jgi:hypothetical protein
MEGHWGICGPIFKAEKTTAAKQEDKTIQKKSKGRSYHGCRGAAVLVLGSGHCWASVVVVAVHWRLETSKLRRPGLQTNRARCRGLSRPRLVGVIGPKRQADKPATKRVAVPRSTAAATGANGCRQRWIEQLGEMLHDGLGGSCEWRWARWIDGSVWSRWAPRDANGADYDGVFQQRCGVMLALGGRPQSLIVRLSGFG